MKTFYITQWALTKGILSVSDSNAEVVDAYLYVSQGSYRSQVRPGEWSTSLFLAQQRTAQLVEKKLRSLVRAIHKFEAYSPKVVCIDPVEPA
jgi:hypothetical protein